MNKNDKNNEYLCGDKRGEIMFPEKYVRFDWAAKRLFRDKADFRVLEGLVSVLLNEKITILELLDSEDNREYYEDKYNHVDIKAKNSRDEIILVEIQQKRQSDFLLRMLYGVSKSITEHVRLREQYKTIIKVYSINIVYFDLGKGADYLYHGYTTFTGINTHDTLQITQKQHDALKIITPRELFPEYYIVRVNEYGKEEAETPLEEWLDYLKNGRIKDDTTTPGLQEAKETLQYMMMSQEDKNRYFRFMDSLMVERDALDTSYTDGLWDGREKGRAEGFKQGRAEGKAEIIKNMLSKGFNVETTAEITGLTTQEIEESGYLAH